MRKYHPVGKRSNKIGTHGERVMFASWNAIFYGQLWLNCTRGQTNRNHINPYSLTSECRHFKTCLRTLLPFDVEMSKLKIEFLCLENTGFMLKRNPFFFNYDNYSKKVCLFWKIMHNYVCSYSIHKIFIILFWIEKYKHGGSNIWFATIAFWT